MKVRPPQLRSPRDTLDEYRELQTSREAAFDEIAMAAAAFCATPYASINLCSSEGLWSKAHCGPDASVGILFAGLLQKQSPCLKVVTTGKSLVLPDLTIVPEWMAHPLGNQKPFIKGYLSVPLLNPDGLVIGTICVLDAKKRSFGSKHLKQLEFLARQTANLVELRKTSSAYHAMQKELTIQHQNLLETKKIQREFLAHLSHEMATPLNSILGLSELLSDSAPQARPQEAVLLTNLKKSSHHLIETFNSLLEHSKIESGQLRLNPSFFDLKEFTLETIAPFELLARSRGLDFKVGIDLPSAHSNLCQGDKVRLRQVLNNLLNNALKFTEKGSITLQLECSETRGNESLISFRITDSGIGIPRDQHSRLFEPYSQVSGDLSKGGSGLGLSICKKIVESMDGQIGLESEANKGSTFWFMLPLKTTQGNLSLQTPFQAVSTAVASDRITNPVRALEGLVLLVEDNALSSAVTQSFLEKTGLELRAAATLAETLYLLDTHDFDLILLDLHLGSVSPETLLKEIRQKSSAPVITISGSDISRQKSLELEIDDALQKPFSKEALLQKLQVWLSETKDKNHLIREWEDSLLKLAEQCGSDFLVKTIYSFVERHPPELQKLHRYLEDGQWDKLELTAHSMKSTLATLGLMQLARLSQELEELASSEDLQLLAPLLDQFQMASRKTYHLLVRYVEHEFLSCEKAS